MKKLIAVLTRAKGTDEEPYPECYTVNSSDPYQWAIDLVDEFNSSLRPFEREREVVKVLLVSEKQYASKQWEKRIFDEFREKFEKDADFKPVELVKPKTKKRSRRMLVCENCAKEFYNKRKRKYCSKECRYPPKRTAGEIATEKVFVRDSLSSLFN